MCSVIGCGNKTALSEFDPFVPGVLPAPVRYVLVGSPWTGAAIGGFNRPTDIIAGYDNTLYVIDAGNNRIVQIDEAGNVIGTSPPIPNMKAIAQRRNMELLITAKANGLAVVYAINLVGANGKLNEAVPQVIYRQPVAQPADTLVNFTAIATVEDNAFYVASTGGPDTLIKFSSRNRFQESVRIQPSPPTVLAYPIEATYLEGISAIASVTQPPQNTAIGSGVDFFFVCDAPEVLYKIRWVKFNSGFSIQGIFFSNTQNLSFIKPADITYDPERQHLFIVDAGTNKLYQLNTRLGIEGTSGVRALDQPFFVNIDFTTFGTTGDKLNAPQGVCYLNRTLYISDTGNNRVLRFKLTYDIEGIPVP